MMRMRNKYFFVDWALINSAANYGNVSSKVRGKIGNFFVTICILNKCYVCKEKMIGKSFSQKEITKVLMDMLVVNGGSIVGKRTMKNIMGQILRRKTDCYNIWGMKWYQQSHLESLLLILIAANMFDYECEISTEGKEVIVNLKWDDCKEKLNIQSNNCWKLIPE